MIIYVVFIFKKVFVIRKSIYNYNKDYNNSLNLFIIFWNKIFEDRYNVYKI